MPMLALPYGTIRYESFSNSEHASEATPALFIHGYGAMIEHWNKNIPAVAATRPVYAMDLLGFGESEKPKTDYGLELWSNQIQTFLDEKRCAKVNLVAHSMGAAASLWFAHHAPERVERLVLIDPSGIFPDDVSALEKLLYRAVGSAFLGEAMFGIFANEFGARQSLVPTYYNTAQVTDALVEQFAKPLRSTGAMNSYLAPSRNPERFLLDTLPRPCRFTGKCLLVWGQYDRAFPPEKILPKFKDLLPQSETAIIENTRHCPHDEQPERVNDLLLDFFQR
jgi:pimeloyl-ACP methyl ester carboxylesterase